MLLPIRFFSFTSTGQKSLLAYHGHRIGRGAHQEIEGAHSKSEDKKHEGPKISLIHQFLACKLKHLDQLGKEPTLQCISGYRD